MGYGGIHHALFLSLRDKTFCKCYSAPTMKRYLIYIHLDYGNQALVLYTQVGEYVSSSFCALLS